MSDHALSDATRPPSATRSRPFTGEEYITSLRDERTVYLNGERVADVTAHPAFRNAG
jgi:4-hydroxyphenylacetate 3-monooxygenase